MSGAASQPTVLCRNVSHVLLDIEGTTCPVSFVAEVLFPYAAAQLQTYLARHGREPGVRELLDEAAEAWAQDQDPAAQQLRSRADAAVQHYLLLLIRQDRKLTPLKQLQGLIWEHGYATGVLRAPLFEDVPPALERWRQQGLILAVYSSGSVQAQQLLYGHSSGGDLRSCFSHWFDTRSGPKRNPDSYRSITAAMEARAAHVLFVSDALEEGLAAREAGLQVVFSSRAGNPGRDPGPLACVENYADLVIVPAASENTV